MKIVLNIFVVLLCLIVRSQEQYVGFDTDLEEEGKTTVHVMDIELKEFLDKYEEFRSIVAVYSSLHCKKSSSHCEAEDKHIRAKDVIITENTAWGDNDGTKYVKVKLYIRDHIEPTKPALTANQLASVFYNYADKIEHDYGYRVEVYDPAQSDLEGWQIAVIVILSVLLAGFIVFAIVFGYKQYSRNKESFDNITNEDIDRLSSGNTAMFDDITPGYRALTQQASHTGIGTATNGDPVVQDYNRSIADSDTVNIGSNEDSGNIDTTNILSDEFADNTAM